MPHDLLIRNAKVVDGTGAPHYQADIAVAQGRITEIGRLKGSASRVIDADGLVVAPGFIDPHTHYDAQICWDPLITCSSWHGVTTVVMGNCGVGLAPCKPAEREVAAWNLVHVEAIPYDVLNQGITWDWETFPQYMDAAQRRGLGINVGFLAALSPFRHWAMGEEAMGRAATETEKGEDGNRRRGDASECCSFECHGQPAKVAFHVGRLRFSEKVTAAAAVTLPEVGFRYVRESDLVGVSANLFLQAA